MKKSDKIINDNIRIGITELAVFSIFLIGLKLLDIFTIHINNKKCIVFKIYN